MESSRGAYGGEREESLTSVNSSSQLIQEILVAWGWIGIRPASIVGENPFGNLIIEDDLGTYWRLCPEDCYCKIVADSKEQFDQLSVDQSFLEDWYMESLVASAEEKFGPLLDGKKYHFKIPSILGGEYAQNNFTVLDQIEQIRFSGDIARQIHDLPDGAQIELKIGD
ncbi:T6SS immunity protein Tdi1 domain-containing protein [Undibacterium macrobrachii]|uniref:T6SS immunity protein Tdi1 domain-containing protein n=1 Tax=Undibacterium macrobrachii TaxID=1119058 RepID=UPI001E52039F|nr:T6SS immunity protein Tdi1 domain-containing protein [Undibacterium macrobrachii]